MVLVLLVEHSSVLPYISSCDSRWRARDRFDLVGNCPLPAFKVYSLGRGQGLGVLRTKHLTIDTALAEILKELG